jgi:MFS transporter, DHA1 family, tetracycline resistance protein
MGAAVLGYTGYALASQGWMMYVVGLTTFLFALTYPSMNALASQQIPANAQGELQGAVGSLYSLSAIIGPPLMTQIMSRFSDPTGRVHFPGAAFLAAATLTVACAVLFLRALRLTPEPLAAHDPAAASEA